MDKVAIYYFIAIIMIVGACLARPVLARGPKICCKIENGSRICIAMPKDSVCPFEFPMEQY